MQIDRRHETFVPNAKFKSSHVQLWGVTLTRLRWVCVYLDSHNTISIVLCFEGETINAPIQA